jgi:sugar phosphate isomerase/epimerase
MYRSGAQIGINGRFFPVNWRPARNEISFARQAGFAALQFPGKEEGLNASHLDDTPETVGALLAEAGLTPVMEIVGRITPAGRTHRGLTPLELLAANLPAIKALGCRYVHWHLVITEWVAEPVVRQVEESLHPQLVAAVALAGAQGFTFGLEHNEPELMLFGDPTSCRAALDAAPGLGFVWDLNHTTPDHLPAFLDLAPRMSMLHVSDTPLPEVNYHLPVGMGNIDFARHFALLAQQGFAGPAILEIGGLPKSGGYGRDTDEALVDSYRRLRALLGDR